MHPGLTSDIKHSYVRYMLSKGCAGFGGFPHLLGEVYLIRCQKLDGYVCEFLMLSELGSKWLLADGGGG